MKLKIRIKMGFTLIELMIVLSVISILAMVSVPSFKTSMNNNRLLGESNVLASYITLARTEAVRRNDYVSICATSDNTTCSGSDFSTGALIFVNSNSTGLTTSSQIVKIMDKFSGSLDKGKITSTGAITFSPSSAIITGSVLVCTPGYDSYTVNVLSNGAVSKTKNTGDNGC